MPASNGHSEDCTAIDNVYCTLDQTIYGFYPSLGANAFFAALFGICLIIQLFQGLRWKSWTFMIALGFSCLGETIG